MTNLRVFRCGRAIKVTPKLQAFIENELKHSDEVIDELTRRLAEDERDYYDDYDE